MGIYVKGYKLGGGSLTADIYVQLGRQPVATQKKPKQGKGGESTGGYTYETMYLALAHGSDDPSDKSICIVRQGGVKSDKPVQTNIYTVVYNDLKAVLKDEGYEISES